MKKILFLAAIAMLTLSCTGNKAPKVLVLYYSQNATTKAVAEEICNRLGADIEAIVPVKPYDGTYQETIARCIRERESGELPEIRPIASDLSKYDVIFLGYPIWFGTYALPMASLVNSVDFSGKKIVPFCSFGSGGLDASIRDLKEKQPDAEILPGYGVRTARIDAAPKELDRFLKENGFVAGEVEKLEAFPEAHAASAEEAAIFDAAVGDYPMMNAKAEKVSSRNVPGGKEYLFVARDIPREEIPDAPARFIKVYVLAENGQAPVFTQVLR